MFPLPSIRVPHPIACISPGGVLREYLPAISIGLALMAMLADAGAQPSDSPGATRPAQVAFDAAAELQNSAQYDLAAEDWEKLLRRYPRDPLSSKALYYAGVCRSQLNDFSKAEAHFRQLLEQSPDFEHAEDAYLSLGWSQYSLGAAGDPKMYSAALGTFKRLSEKYPESRHLDQAHFYAGESHYARGNPKQAIAHYARLANRHRESPLYANALYALGVTYEEESQFKQARQVYDRFLADCQSSDLITEVRMRKAETILQSGDAAEAERQFATISAIPDFDSADHALWRQAFCAVKQSEYLRGGGLYAKLARTFPRSEYRPAAELAAGRCYYRVQQYEMALPWLKQILDSGGPDRVEAAHWLAQIYLSEGNPDQALRVTEQVLSENNGAVRYLPFLRLDQIDAQAAGRPAAAAAAAYLDFARRNAAHQLAPQALYNSAYTWMELKQYRQAEEVADQFLGRHSDHELFVDVSQIAAESALQRQDYVAAERRYSNLLATHNEHPDRSSWEIRRGLTFYLRNEYQRTIEVLNSRVSRLSQPTEIAEVEFLLGMSEFGLNRFEASAAHLQRSLAATAEWNRADEALLHLSRAQHKIGQDKLAVVSIEKMRRQFPDSTFLDQADFYLGEFAFEAGNYAAARTAYSRLADDEKESNLVPHARYGLGWTELKSGNLEAAAREFSQLLESFPDHALAADAQLGRGMVNRRQNRHDEAIRDIDAYLDSQPEGTRRIDALFERGMAAVGQEDFAAATRFLDRILQESPEYSQTVNVLYELAWAHKKFDNPKQAAAAFQRMIESASQDHPLVAEAYFHIGEERYANKRYESALEAFQRATSTAREKAISEQSRHKLAWTYFRLERYQAAAEAFRDQLRQHPRGDLGADAQFMQAECLFQQKDYRAAWPAFRAAAEKLPKSRAMQVFVFLHGGQAAAELKDWAASIDFLGRIPTDYADSDYLAEAVFERGQALRERKDMSAALADFEKAASLSRGEVGARARFMIGESHFQAKAFETAINHYRRVVYGYGGDDANDAVKTWQAFAAYEAARCEEIRAQQAKDPTKKSEHLTAAVSFYKLMIAKDPSHELVEHASQRLKALTGGIP